MMKHSIAAAAALMLAACGSQSEGDGEKAGEKGAAVTSGAAGGGAVAMTPGQWEMTVQMIRMTVPGMPEGASPPAMPATTIRTCLTPEQASQPNADFLTGTSANGDCSYENMSMGGGRLQGSVQCNTPGGAMRATFEGQFTPTSYEMTQQAQVGNEGSPGMEMETRITGRRIGDCPAG